MSAGGQWSEEAVTCDVPHTLNLPWSLKRQLLSAAKMLCSSLWSGGVFPRESPLLSLREGPRPPPSLPHL